MEEDHSIPVILVGEIGTKNFTSIRNSDKDCADAYIRVIESKGYEKVNVEAYVMTQVQYFELMNECVMFHRPYFWN